MHSTPSIAMSNSQALLVWFQCWSFGSVGPGISRWASMVDADAAKPHRAGVAQDNWSSTSRLVTQIMPPENTSWDMIDTTSIGMIWSCDWASADSAMPSSAAPTQVAATVTNSSRLTLPSSTAFEIGVPQPITEIAVAIAACTIAKTENSTI